MVEFIPKSDQKVGRLLATREDIFPGYNQENFERYFSEYFDIKSVQGIKDSKRTLYLMQGR